MYLLFSTGSTSDFYGQLFRPDPFHPASIEVDEEIWEVKYNKQTNKQTKKKQTDTERIFSRSIVSTVLRLKNLSSIHLFFCLFFCWYKFSEDYNQFRSPYAICLVYEALNSVARAGFVAITLENPTKNSISM